MQPTRSHQNEEKGEKTGITKASVAQQAAQLSNIKLFGVKRFGLSDDALVRQTVLSPDCTQLGTAWIVADVDGRLRHGLYLKAEVPSCGCVACLFVSFALWRLGQRWHVVISIASGNAERILGRC